MKPPMSQLCKLGDALHLAILAPGLRERYNNTTLNGMVTCPILVAAAAQMNRAQMHAGAGADETESGDESLRVAADSSERPAPAGGDPESNHHQHCRERFISLHLQDVVFLTA